MGRTQAPKGIPLFPTKLCYFGSGERIALIHPTFSVDNYPTLMGQENPQWFLIVGRPNPAARVKLTSTNLIPFW